MRKAREREREVLSRSQFLFGRGKKSPAEFDPFPVLVEEIMGRLTSDLALTEMPAIDASVMGALSIYEWPGNVRGFATCSNGRSCSGVVVY